MAGLRHLVIAAAIVPAGLLVANVVPGGPEVHLVHAQTPDSSLVYAENGTRPVGTFRAYDQDRDPIVWSLSGPDGDLFTINGGVLRFAEPPNHENPQSAADDNVYRVTIKASEGTHEVSVTVTDVDEAGTVNISRPQPQVSRPLSASLSDEDEGVTAESWQWARSADGTQWTEIAGATSPRRSPAPGDVGMYLRAAVTYSDKFGTGKTASAVSANRVEAKTLSNAAPSFADQDQDEETPYIDVKWSVAENTAVGMKVGRAVSATDPDEDILFYELVDTPDLADDDEVARFTIDSASGQIRVGKELGADALAHLDDPDEREDEDSTNLTGSPELPEDEDADEAGNSEYVLRVKVSDPSTASATVNVIVTVNQVNEPLLFDEDAPTVLKVRENAVRPVFTFGESDTEVDAETFAVEDPDGEDTTSRYSLSGTDINVLSIGSNGILSFKAGHKPDYELKSSYSITVVAESGVGSRRLTNSLDLVINVVNTDDPGSVFLSQREPRVGIWIHASVRDDDGGVVVTKWVWERSSEITAGVECIDDPSTPAIGVGGWSTIAEASSSTYIPKGEDVGRCLRARATYTDSTGNAAVPAMGVLEVPVQGGSPADTGQARDGGFVNAAPVFPDQDPNTLGDQSDSTSRKVAENTKAGGSIGPPVSAGDDDDDLLIYALGGPDAASFGITRTNGQLKTKATLNYEGRNAYTVVVTATDPAGAADSILVTIDVTDVNDLANIVGPTSISYLENGKGPVSIFSATDQDGDPIVWSLAGIDADLFTLEGGVLTFKKSPDYEDPKAMVTGGTPAERNAYSVTLMATGGVHKVVVNVTNVDENGVVDLSRPQPQVSRSIEAVLDDQDEPVSDETWQWARSEDGATWTDLRRSTSPVRTPAEEDVGTYLRATVTYTDKFGEGKTASAVTANRVEARTAANAAPSFAGQDLVPTSRNYVDVTRSVDENSPVGTSVGKPVSATDADGDVLIYSLVDTPDLKDGSDVARFTIDSASGQIKVGKLLGADRPSDSEESEDETTTAEQLGFAAGATLPSPTNANLSTAVAQENNQYVLRIRAEDPSTADEFVNVIVTVHAVNEAPEFGANAPTVLRVEEGQVANIYTGLTGTGLVAAATYAVTDVDTDTDATTALDTTLDYEVEGADAKYFTFDDSNVLVIDQTVGGTTTGYLPDYEEKISYSITIAASSGDGARKLTSRLDVTVNVTDAEDDGSVMLSHREPQVGRTVMATLTDPDGGITINSWRWYRGGTPSGEPATMDVSGASACTPNTDAGTVCTITSAKSAAYIPTEDDIGLYLTAVATYTDGVGAATPATRAQMHTEAVVQDRSPANAAPKFPDQDPNTAGEQSGETTRSVAENTDANESIGAAVGASDDDDDLLLYTLGGVDADSFAIDRTNGQLMTKAALDYERKRVYMVVVTATDPSGAAASILVVIHVGDVDDPAEIRVLQR